MSARTTEARMLRACPGIDRHRPVRSLELALTAATLLIGLAGPAHSDPLSDFYKSKDLRVLISTTPGTGYDTYARAVARNIGRHLPGNPSIVPQHMPGAGGITAANYLYAVAPKDGSVFGLLQNTVPFEPLFENKAALF